MRLTPRLLASSLLLLSACSHGKPNPVAATSSTTTVPSVVTMTGTVHVTGTLASFTASAALTDAVAAPFTITVAEAGRGGFQIAGAIVDGKPQTIVWSGGRPLPVTGACSLDVSEAPLDIAPTGATFHLDNGVRALTAGACAFASSVAVGNGGLAESVPSVRFTLAHDATFEPTGGATVVISPARHFEGHHGSATASGDFTVTDQIENTWRATKIVLGNGTWILDVTKTLRVEAQFGGGLTILRQ